MLRPENRSASTDLPVPLQNSSQVLWSVDYRGIVKMCCNVIPDSAPEHERYAVGSAADATLAELWNSGAMTTWRARHAAADWSASPACRTCVQALPETRR
jgi:Iron-sulfur cluster-binding domain